MGYLRLTTFLLGLALVSGCATSGPNHVYLTTVGGSAVHDLGPPPADIAGAVEPVERVLGLAYDFNTDHLFVRLARSIRVIERPSGKILRELPLPPELRTDSLPRSVPEDTAPADKPRAPSKEQQGADLAIRSSNRHLFALSPDGHYVVELTLLGEVVRRIELPGLSEPISGLAFDQRRSRLLALAGNVVFAYALDNREVIRVTLRARVHAVTLGYDSDAQHYFVPLADGQSVGEFDSHGKLVATRQVAPAGPITAIDAGPRSLVRVF